MPYNVLPDDYLSEDRSIQSAVPRTPPVGREQITGLSAAKSLTPPSGARWATIKPRGRGVYLNLLGFAPSSADMLISIDVPVDVTTPLENVRLIEVAASAIVDVWYFG